MIPRLRELVEERERRRLKRAEDAWRAKRAAADPASLCAGELANMLEGLTPDGFDRMGRKVSFAEHGEPLYRSGISGPVLRGFDR